MRRSASMHYAAIAILTLGCRHVCSVDERVPTRFGEAIAAVHDVNGDGVRDLAVEVTGGVALYSGKTGSLLWHASGVVFALAPIEDVNDDGVPDVLTGGMGIARVLSGLDGRELLAVREPSVAGFGRDVDSLGDVDGDGFVEFLVAGNVSARIHSARPGVRVVGFGTDIGILDAHPMGTVGDVDGDGIVDLAWVDWARGNGKEHRRPRIRVVAGGTWVDLLLLDLGPGNRAPCYSWEDVHSIAAAGDVDGDSRGDILVSTLDHCVQTFSGRDGAVLATFADPFPGGYLEGFGDTLVALGDIDGDRVSDVAVGCKEYLDSGDSYYASVFSGRTGKQLHVFEHEHWPGHFHFVAGPGDVDGDGVPDIAVSVPDCGSLKLHSGADFGWIRTLHPPGGG